MSNKTKNLLLCIFVIMATVGVFLLVNRDNFELAMCWYTLGIIFLSEAVLSAIWITSGNSPQKVAVVLVAAVQTVVNIFASIIFLASFEDALIGYTVFCIISFTLLVVIAYFLYRGASASEKTQGSKEFFTGCRNEIHYILTTPNGKEYGVELTKLEENIRFCNDGVFLPTDNEIYAEICVLKSLVENRSPDVFAAIAKINGMLEHHDFVAKTTKR